MNLQHLELSHYGSTDYSRIKAHDNLGNIFQIEIQLFVTASLKQRMIHNWAELYSHQLKEGDHWNLLKPVISIWLVSKPVFQDYFGFHSHFCLYDEKNRLKLTEHANIHIIELSKWDKSRVENDLDRWTRFFRDGKTLNDAHLPNYMLTEEMEQAMAVLKQFSEKERDYDRYRARVNYLRDQKTLEEERELAKAELKETKKELTETNQTLNETSQTLNETNQALNEKNQALNEASQALNEASQALDEKAHALKKQTETLDMQTQVLEEKDRLLAEKENELEKLKFLIKHSKNPS